MSLIGTLAQLKLSDVLQRIEAYEKTGLLVIQQTEAWVEFYFRDGRMMCIGPVNGKTTLADRLLQDGIISPQAVQETMRVLGSASPSETQIALTLMERGIVGHETLRSWATKKAIEVLQVLLTWVEGEIHFVEGAAPSADRLLVALSVSALLASVPTHPARPSAPMQPQIQTTAKREVVVLPKAAEAQPIKRPAKELLPDITKIPTVLNAADLLFNDIAEEAGIEEDPPTMLFATPNTQTPTAASKKESDAPFLLVDNDGGDQGFSLFDEAQIKHTGPAASTLQSPQPVSATAPTPSRPIDISYMRPDMVLMPTHLSAQRDNNTMVQLTPDQWRLLTQVDGRTTLQKACQALAMLPDAVCRIAGELAAENLIQLSLSSIPMHEMSPVARELQASGLSPDYVIPGNAASATSWAPTPGAGEVSPSFTGGVPFETQSQWGNGGNGATFVPGRGWIASPQPMQPLNPTDSLGASGIYDNPLSYAGGKRQ